MAYSKGHFTYNFLRACFSDSLLTVAIKLEINVLLPLLDLKNLGKVEKKIKKGKKSSTMTRS